MLFVETGRETEVRQFDVSILVNEDVIWLDITGRTRVSITLSHEVSTCGARTGG